MDTCPVVRVEADNDDGFTEINASDFDSRVHRLYGGDTLPDAAIDQLVKDMRAIEARIEALTPDQRDELYRRMRPPEPIDPAQLGLSLEPAPAAPVEPKAKAKKAATPAAEPVQEPAATPAAAEPAPAAVAAPGEAGEASETQSAGNGGWGE